MPDSVNGCFGCSVVLGIRRASSLLPTKSQAWPLAVGCGLWAVGCGLWAVGCGARMLGASA
ncbi:hypothetical protein [Acetobacter cerevisiae]|uniref:hypothetical protein n=1 Tax=Acetobacter cerevisiae TaxID=178900 RepID=UPI00209FC552|nr:hypothetical protein [Acetobacter cerevisiae]MCP1271881.1 hypothetical protein [Acetobacter cerevisiae]MCP1279832.1 hypothetical protein [Acetobacter cerevisiae]